MKARFVLPVICAMTLQVAGIGAATKGSGGSTSCQAPVPINPVWNSCTSGSQLSGCLDSTFNGTGLVTTGLGGSGEPVAVKQDAAGNLFAIGQVSYPSGTPALAIVHYLANGTLDPGFASGGILIDQVPGATSIFGTYDAAIDPSGNLLVVVSIANGYSVRRYSPSGVLDSAFNSNALSSFSGLTIDRPDALRLQSDGAIVVSGDYISSRKVVGFVFRMNPDGTRDQTFGSKGLVLVNSLAGARGAALQSIGSNHYFVLGGTVSKSLALVRLTSSGSIDTTFGTGGIITTAYCVSAAIFGLAVDGSSNILAASQTQLVNRAAYKVLPTRYTANGFLDTTFGDPSGSSGSRTGQTVFDTFGGMNNVSEVAPALDSAGHILISGNGNTAHPVEWGTCHRRRCHARVRRQLCVWPRALLAIATKQQCRGDPTSCL